MNRLLITALALLLCAPSFADCVFREDTASQIFQIGPFLDETTGIDPEVSLTISNTDVRLSKAGGNIGAKNSGACTHDELGMYACTFNATDTDTAGMLQIVIDEAGAVPVFHECLVLATEYYDLLDGTTSIMTSRQAGNVLETTITTATSQTELDLVAGASNDDAYNNMTAMFQGGTEECERRITDYTGTGAILFLESACPFTLAGADTVRVHVGAAGKAVEDVDAAVAALNDLTAAQVNAEVDTALTDISLDKLIPVSSTADSGNTVSLVDASLTQGDNYWNDDYMVVVNLAAGPEARCITDFDAGTDTLTWTPAMNASVGTETFIIIPQASCALTQAKIATNAIGSSEIAAGAIGADEIATDAIGAAELAADASAEIWAVSCEDQGGGYSCRETMSLLLSEAMGTCVYTSGTRTWVCSDPSGAETRFTLVYGTELDGDRDTSTPAPMTP